MKTFKIFGNGIGTNKTYKSLEDAKNAIQENKIEPLIDNLCVIIEETIKKHGVKMVFNVGGGKVRSSSELLKNYKLLS